MRKYLLVIAILLSTMACSLSFNLGAPDQPAQQPNEFAVITYVYSPNANGGIDISFLAEKSGPNPGFTFDGGKPPTRKELESKVSASPLPDLGFKMSNPANNEVFTGKTDSGGHLRLSLDFTSGDIFVDSSWDCSPVTTWQDLESGKVVDGGAIWTCQRYVAPIPSQTG